MQAGRLRHRIAIQIRSSSQDSYGQPVETWTTQHIRWASIEPLQGREFFSADQVNSEVSVRIRMRYLAGITAGMRVLYDNEPYNIEAVINPKMRNKDLQLMCSVGVNNG